LFSGLHLMPPPGRGAVAAATASTVCAWKAKNFSGLVSDRDDAESDDASQGKLACIGG
jgi:hypothetical protein